uniref:NAD-dependent protein deacetylase n=1 Tax=Erpetoichthys calabaricus TaxID=27687 RepID=A0A8C4X468_ERPCA
VRFSHFSCTISFLKFLMLFAQDSDSDEEYSEGAVGDPQMDFLKNFFSRTLGLGGESQQKSLEELSLNGVAKYIQSEKCKNIICMVGAGISTSAGIPDFRSPGTGLYDNLQKYDLPYPEAIFDIGYFKEHPEPFFALARELYPGQFKPTICHYFIRLLKDKGLLKRCYTQNIDTLERVAGYLTTCKCVLFIYFYPRKNTHHSFSPLLDIVFFGESLPARFFSSVQSDFPACDLLIIMGTSLKVQPFASLISKVPSSTPRLLINKEKAGKRYLSVPSVLAMDFDSEKAYRDVAYLATCDDGCRKLAELLGWKEELEEMVKHEYAKIDSSSATGAASSQQRQPKGKTEAKADTTKPRKNNLAIAE